MKSARNTKRTGRRPLPMWAWSHSRPSLALFTSFILAIALSGLPSAAQPKQDLLAANVDPSISPADDFFRYANGEWLRRHPIPDDQARWGIWNVASQRLYEQLREISAAAATKKAPRGSAEQLIGDFWATGMDAAAINKEGISALQPDLDRIQRIQSIDDLIDVVASLHRKKALINAVQPGRVLFAGGVVQDESNSERWIYALAQGGISAGRLVYSSGDPQRIKIRSALREYLLTTFVRLHGDREKAGASADAVYNLEAELAKGFDSSDETQAMTVAELSRLAPAIDWKRYFRGLDVSAIDLVDVRNPRSFQTLDSTLRTIPLHHWKDYLRFWLITLNAPFLDDRAYSDFFAYNSAYTGQQQPPPRWRRVVWQEKNWLGLPLVRLFTKEYLPKDRATRYQAVAESVRRAFRDRIADLDWMSDSTKDSALLKLARLKITIGLPEQSIDFSTMPLRRDSYVLNVMRAAEWFHQQEIKRLNGRVDRSAIDLHPGIGGDAHYDAANNEVHVPNPIAAPGVPDAGLDDAFVYGSTSLGHEIAHALDSQGRQYDAHGNKRDWWTGKDAVAFDQRAQVLIEQYNEFMPIEGVHVDGRRSLPENMADLAGIRIKLDAFKKTEQFKRDERVGGFTPLQRFFLAHAYSQMCHERQERLASMLAGGGYAPCRERVNGVLMNIPEFFEAFGVKAGDRMYRPEAARVRIYW